MSELTDRLRASVGPCSSQLQVDPVSGLGPYHGIQIEAVERIEELEAALDDFQEAATEVEDNWESGNLSGATSTPHKSGFWTALISARRMAMCS